jgi:hypothetical protein
MPKIPVAKLEPGMRLARPVTAKNGMVMLGEGTELSETRIERIRDMAIVSVFVEGPSVQAIPKEEAIADLEARFAKAEGKSHMNMIKRITKEHIEGLYE